MDFVWSGRGTNCLVEAHPDDNTIKAPSTIDILANFMFDPLLFLLLMNASTNGSLHKHHIFKASITDNHSKVNRNVMPH